MPVVLDPTFNPVAHVVGLSWVAASDNVQVDHYVSVDLEGFKKISQVINGVQVCRNGAAGDDRSLVDLSGRDITILVDLHAGNQAATIWTNDLSHAYVEENSAYSS